MSLVSLNIILQSYHSCITLWICVLFPVCESYPIMIYLLLRMVENSGLTGTSPLAQLLLQASTGA